MGVDVTVSCIPQVLHHVSSFHEIIDRAVASYERARAEQQPRPPPPVADRSEGAGDAADQGVGIVIEAGGPSAAFLSVSDVGAGAVASLSFGPQGRGFA